MGRIPPVNHAPQEAIKPSTFNIIPHLYSKQRMNVSIPAWYAPVAITKQRLLQAYNCYSLFLIDCISINDNECKSDIPWFQQFDAISANPIQ